MVRESLSALWRYALAALALGLLWQLGSALCGDTVLPSPLGVGALFLRSLTDPAYLSHLSVSCLRLLGGLALSAPPALALGLCLGHRPGADRLLAPLIFLTYPIPKIVFLPVFFMLLGLGESSRVTLIALTAGYQILVVVRAGAKALDPGYAGLVGFMGGGAGAALRHVWLPAAGPDFFTGLRVAGGTAVAVLFLAESFATSSGLGFLIMDAWGLGDAAGMFNGILGMSLLGLALYALIWLAERICCPWRATL